MELMLGFVLILAIAWTVPFYAARMCLRGVICLIDRSAMHHRR